MTTPASAATDPAVHKRLAAELFSEVWRLLNGERTPDDDLRMVHAAHASRHHWEAAGGTPVNLAMGEWQISRVYAALGRPEPALFHARRALEIAEREGFAGFNLAFTLEGFARALLAAGQRENATAAALCARSVLPTIADEEDRQVVEQDLESLGF